MTDHELVIRGGTVVDGTGAAARVADVAIDDGIVTTVGDVQATGREEIDADGLLVTPGWVDVHTHYDGQVTWDPFLTPSSWQGVTTVVMGNCGVGFAPVRPDRHDSLIRLMEGVEDIPGTALHEGITWGWESFPEYLDVVDCDTARDRFRRAGSPRAPCAPTSWETAAPTTRRCRRPTRSRPWAVSRRRRSTPARSASRRRAPSCTVRRTVAPPPASPRPPTSCSASPRRSERPARACSRSSPTSTTSTASSRSCARWQR